MMSMIRGTSLLISDATVHQISGPEAFLFIGTGRVFAVPLPVFVFAGVAALLYFIQTPTPFGLTVFAVGENQESARFAGLPVLRTKR